LTTEGGHSPEKEDLERRKVESKKESGKENQKGTYHRGRGNTRTGFRITKLSPTGEEEKALVGEG